MSEQYAIAHSIARYLLWGEEKMPLKRALQFR